MKSRVSLRAAFADQALLGNVLTGDSWRAWRGLLIAAMGEPLDDAAHGRTRPGTGAAR
jgi:hypothetical protein